MQFEVNVRNLGRIKDATFQIRPITVITGPNATGKSFFTKVLYSVLRVGREYDYLESIIRYLDSIPRLLSMLDSNDQQLKSDSIRNEIDKLIAQLIEVWNSGLDIIELEKFAISKISEIKGIIEYFQYICEDKMILYEDIITKIERGFRASLDRKIPDLLDELKENFQLTNLNELINFQAEAWAIDLKGLFELKVDVNNHEGYNFTPEFINTVLQIPSVYFLESPAYWKVRDVLKAARIYVPGKQNPADILNGVPKYFYDVDEALTLKTKTPGQFQEALKKLEQGLRGGFDFRGDGLSFIDKDSGREIPVNRVSFGMTNLGILHALLKYNIIQPNSFIFIDEPESHLHPDWQLLLVEVLLLLADKGVNIVLTTHSTDTLKALEVRIKQRQLVEPEQYLAAHFLDTDGKLADLGSGGAIEKLIEARGLLSMTYERLYLEDL